MTLERERINFLANTLAGGPCDFKRPAPEAGVVKLKSEGFSRSGPADSTRSLGRFQQGFGRRELSWSARRAFSLRRNHRRSFVCYVFGNLVF